MKFPRPTCDKCGQTIPITRDHPDAKRMAMARARHASAAAKRKREAAK